MGILSWLGYERRSFSSRDDELGRLLSGGVMYQSGQVVSPRSAEGLATVTACISAVSSALATLPTFVYRVSDTGREVDWNHPLQRLIRRGPNPYQSWPSFIEWLVASTLLTGNGLAEIVVDARGAVVELRPIPWHLTSVTMLPSGRLSFEVSEPSLLGQATARRKLMQDQVFLLTDRSDDGLLGVSRLRRAAAVIGGALAQQEFAHNTLSNGVYPSGIVKASGKLDNLQRQQLTAGFRSFAGTDKAAKALILDQGLEFSSLSISPEDAEMLGSRRFTGEELCRIYSVPPPIIGDLTHGTFANVQDLLRWFAQHCLASWCRKLEAELERQVLSETSSADHQIEVDLSGLLRGDPETRWKSHQIAIQTGVLTRNEVREVEGYAPLPEQAQPVPEPVVDQQQVMPMRPAA